VWMAELSDELTHVWSHKARIALFLAAMRHFRNAQEKRGWPVLYRALDDRENSGDLASEISNVVELFRPADLVLVEPSEFRVKRLIERTAADLQLRIEMRPDRHFLCSHEEFDQFAEGRKQLRMEHFYRQMRRKTGVLMKNGQPAGGKWNYDAENRAAFGRAGPRALPLPPSFPPDAITREVIALVSRRFASHPGRLDTFDWPVTDEHAQMALDDFLRYRLANFGTFQDAMWTDEPFLYHSLLSAALNLKLLQPDGVVVAAEQAFHKGLVPLNAAEGFIRQILGWREYVRGIYWQYMPDYLDYNVLEAHLPLPEFYWTAETEMNCLRQVFLQTLHYGYAHHIQRLMVTGLFALLLGVSPDAVHRWYLAVYVDALEWVELPNTLGMSQFADGGIMASKPYVASGKYLDRMSNYCAACQYDPAKACGELACPFTVLYWDFLERKRGFLKQNPRMNMQLGNLNRKSANELRTIRHQASTIRSGLC